MPKYYLTVILTFSFSLVFSQAFITTWKTDNPGVSEDNQIIIPTRAGEVYNYTVDWGDGTISENITGDITHTYAVSGTYQVSISGIFPRILFGRSEGADKKKILEINQWGNIEWKSFASAFNECENLDMVATDLPNLAQVSSFQAVFATCPNLKANETINQWDMSRAEDISYMFYKATSFNQNIGAWNLSNVLEMNDMFHNAAAFNQDLQNWRFPKVTILNSVFERATNFNGDISDWDVSNIVGMGDMFLHAYAFNQNISSWNVANIESMGDMFRSAQAFNQDISGWNVGRVRSMSNMFANAISFDQNLGSWNVGNVVSMSRMFNQVQLSTENYDGILNGWGALTNLQSTVTLDAGFSQYCNGNISRQNLMDNYGWQIVDDGISCPTALSIQEVLLIDAVEDESLYTLREDAQINLQSLPNEVLNFEVLATADVGSVKIELSNTLYFSSTVNEAPYTLFGVNGSDYSGNNLAIGSYTLTVTPYSGDDLTGTSGDPYVLNFKILDGVSRAFITTWKTDNPGTSNNNTISIRTIPGQYYYYDVDWGAGSIYGGVSGNTSYTYQQPGTYTIKITGNFPGLVFDNNGDAPKLISIDQWGDLDWESMEGAFSGCTNMDVLAIDIPDLSNVDSMASMFQGCSLLKGNGAMSNWEMGNVTNMSSMFGGAVEFNQDITNWEVSNVTDMSGLFEGGSSFNQSLGGWNVSQVSDMNDIFTLSGLSDTNYETTLTGWGQLSSLQNGVRLGALQNHYCDATDIRQNLITNYGWIIHDGGLALNCAINGQLPFLTSWKTDNPGFSDNNQITIYTDTRWDGYDYTVDWGDGSVSTNVQGDIVHTYGIPGVYRVAIYGGFPGMHINNGGNARLRDDDKIISIDQWGDNKWDFLGLAFAGCNNMDLKATDVPDLSKNPSLFGMFSDCPSFVGNESMNSWDMTFVSTTAYMFKNASSFNMSLDGWDMKNVLRMYNMFQGASSFDQDLGVWNVSNVINMTEMLNGSGLSNENYNKTLMGWAQLPSLQNGVQLDAPQNQYCKAEEAKKNIIETYSWTINDAGRLCPFITSWKTDNPGSSDDNQITIPTFPGAYYNYNVDWGDGTLSENVRGDITHSYTQAGSYQVSILGEFPRIYFNTFNTPKGDENKIISIDLWGTSRWKSMEHAFAGCKNLDVMADDVPDLRSVSEMQSMFSGCSALVGNSNFEIWDVRNVRRFDYMFSSAPLFNQDIGGWNMSNATSLEAMFIRASTFNQDIGSWTISNVDNLRATFYEASEFNQDIGNWNVSGVNSLEILFKGATSFNQDISGWDVSNVNNMGSTFVGATSFNQDIGQWNVTGVTNMAEMFKDAASFNQDLRNWNVGNVSNMSAMFLRASEFDQSLADWDIGSVNNMSNMFYSIALTNQNYDRTLIGWSQLPALQINVEFGAGNSQYCDSEAARQVLIDTYGWAITDGGQIPLCKEDNDADGVMDHLDSCLNTKAGVAVNPNGCDFVTNSAISVYTLTPSCSGSSDGAIEVEMNASGYLLDIIIEGNGWSDQFMDLNSGELFSVGNLAAGSYLITISIPEILHEQHFGISINELESISGKRTALNRETNSISYTVSGSQQYEVLINGKSLQYNFNNTAQNTIKIHNLQDYNEIKISGLNDCQGKISDSIYMGKSITVYPTIVTETVNLVTDHETVQLGIYNLGGQLIRHLDTIEFSGQSSQIDISTLQPGLYLLRLIADGQEKTIKILKR